jgi:bifunctional DNase/RNase
MTHDLLKTVAETMGGKLTKVVINDLREEIYYAELVIDVEGREVRVDSRPSDAIALAVRAEVPIFVAESVMERAATTPDEEIAETADEEPAPSEPEPPASGGSDDDLDIFANFVDTLDMDDLDE